MYLNCPKNLTSLVLDDMEELILVNGFVKTQCRLEMGTCPKLNKKLADNFSIKIIQAARLMDAITACVGKKNN